MEYIVVRFIAHYGVYQKGEIAKFPRERGHRLIDAGYAVEQDSHFSDDGARLKHIAEPPATKHIPGPDETKDKKPAAGRKPRGGKRK